MNFAFILTEKLFEKILFHSVGARFVARLLQEKLERENERAKKLPKCYGRIWKNCTRFLRELLVMKTCYYDDHYDCICDESDMLV